MMRVVAAGAITLMLLGCATAQDDAPAPVAQPAADPRVAELQTSMTELLDRLDVMSDRIARLEESASAAAAAPAVSMRTPKTPVVEAPVTTQPAAPMTTVVTRPAAVNDALVSADIADDYRKAIVLYGKGNLAESRRGFQHVFDSDPSGDLADNALFWIGETYYAGADYVNAMRFYARVVSEFADQNKAPDALFKTALAHERTGDLALAKATLQQVIERYPYSSPASSAKQELQRIRF